MAKLKITLTTCKALAPGSEDYDTVVGGFRARRQKGDDVIFRLSYTTKDGRARKQTIGRLGSPWTPDTARAEAKRILYEVAAGRDPAGERAEARAAPTVSELCDSYWADAEAGRLLTKRREPKSASTLVTDKGRIERHIKPQLGKLKVAAVTRADVERFMHAVAEGETAGKTKTAKKRGLANVRGGRGTASRTVGLLGAIFTYAVDKGFRKDNPVRGVVRPADGERERRVSADELAALGKALREPGDIWPPAVAMTRFLCLTGWRLGEALALRWTDLDLDRRTANLQATKTGRSMRPLSRAAVEVLMSAPRLGAGKPSPAKDGGRPGRRRPTALQNPSKEDRREVDPPPNPIADQNRANLVFPASRGAGPMSGFGSIWERIAKLAALPADVTPHVLRHSFASVADDLEYSELTIAALLGHRKGSVTSKYAHKADAVLLAAADRVADTIAQQMGDRKSAEVVAFPGTVPTAAEAG